LRTVRPAQVDLRRRSLYKRAVLVAIGGNAFLAASKGLVALLSGSSAVLSDATNSLSDTLYSLLMGLGLYVAQRPADESHPQGHSRFEPLVSLGVALAMFVAGVMAVRESLARFGQPIAAIQLGWPTLVLIMSALVKVGMFAGVRRLGREARSPAIQASARDNLADVLASVSALAGVWGSRLVHPGLDPIAGAVVALWIFRTAWQVTWENLGYLTGRGAPEELTDRIAQTAGEVLGVDGVHRVIADHVGPQLRVDIHITVDPAMALEGAHEISEEVRRRIEALPDVDTAFVHVEPTGEE
jgi:cation diffusion facilitator family transporter